MPRRRATSYDTKLGHIRDTAAGLFARDGFTRTSMAELAGACGVSKALLYHYFDSKEALLFDILRAYLADLEAAVAIAPRAAASPRDHLRDLIRALLRQYREAGNTHKLLTFELAVLADDRQAELRGAERRIMARFDAALAAAAADAGRQAPLDGPRAMMLFGTLNWTYTWFRDDGKLSLDDYCELVTDSTVASLLA
ncbi:MAG: TetR/AcrR family transcriptional regulator [Pseudomonadota bacterium]|nr:TetR/AcrR family transcriptional regulator [Pseudomonadota bacterium]MEC7852679.1 TetR/AcrR family transcriptional regulator [Pseudomonadota bacterium]MEC8105210.1 TetR/AcrR family transcriptional regulator [Pseudomonadota bacterium]MEC8268854.1 TetR/AcrR family transcriptional regulator [Pseudomonadota bacterium]MEC8309895.1 TetR/AcrR family transcriptional regulator [Pseudomonadota bacterium]